ncbi:MAG: polysaccharide deacetylase family protein, partial [Nitrospinota bacterium]
MKFSFLDQMKGELSSLLSCYPSFVFAFHPKPALDFVPVFTYHTIDPAMFEKELCYLKENEYTTLSPGEYFSIIRKEREAPPKAVLLTVDDGRLSFWKYGYPLLKKYGLRATLFIIPGSTVESEKRRANMLDVWAGGIAFDTLASLDAGDYELCSWSEIKEMYASGLINIESHTLFHKEVFISPRF